MRPMVAWGIVIVLGCGGGGGARDAGSDAAATDAATMDAAAMDAAPMDAPVRTLQIDRGTTSVVLPKGISA